MVLALCGCQAFQFSLEDRPCGPSGECLDGYVCDPVTTLCVLPCDPSTESCPGEPPPCTLGTINDCAACGDACVLDHATATCATTSGAHACAIMACDASYRDIDGQASNGCEQPCPDIDADTQCDDLADTCVDVDGDGFGNGLAGNAGCAEIPSDVDDSTALACADSDVDGCDDCSAGTYDPANDGVDLNGDGTCRNSEADEDNDTVGWADGDPDDGDADVCGDSEGDSCDDCALAGKRKTFYDGPDLDRDGFCNAGDCNPAVPTCTDVCASDGDSDNVDGCVEDYCTATKADPDGDRSKTCNVVTTSGGLATVMGAAADNIPTFILIDADITLTSTITISGSKRFIFHQSAGTTLTFNPTSDQALFNVQSNGNEFYDMHISADHLNRVHAIEIFLISGDDNVVSGNRLQGYDQRAIGVIGGSGDASGNVVVGNHISRDLELPAGNGTGTIGAIVLENASNALVAGNMTVINDHPSLVLNNADGARLFHNTLYNFGGAARSSLYFHTGLSSNVCVLNNILMSESAALAVIQFKDDDAIADIVGFQNGGDCTTGGNILFGTIHCQLETCVASPPCACTLPGGFESSLTIDPATSFVNAKVGVPYGSDHFCLASTALINRTAAPTVSTTAFTLTTYDANDLQSGGYNGSAPEPGAREAGTANCPGP